jgi:GT2 family glycosyltransferase
MGPTVLRNQGFKDAAGDIIFSLDDDAYFTSTETVASTVALLAKYPRAAAVAMAYVEPSADASRQMGHIPSDRHVKCFVACACAFRREIAVRFGGYREFFVIQGEERDLTIRFLNEGYEIIIGDAPPIVHESSPRRDSHQAAYYGVQNTLLFDVLNVPQPYFLPRLAADAFSLLRYKLTWRSAPKRFRYVFSGLLACATYWHLRKPVSRETYRRYRALPNHGPLPLAELAGSFSSPGDNTETASSQT